MQRLMLKNNSPVPIHGKKSGQTFAVRCDDDFVPLGRAGEEGFLWRKRLAEEHRLGLGHLVIVGPAGIPANVWAGIGREGEAASADAEAPAPSGEAPKPKRAMRSRPSTGSVDIA